MHDLDADIDPDLLEKFTGQTAVRDLASAHPALDAAREQFVESTKRVRVAVIGLRVATFRYVMAKYGTLPVFDALVLSSALGAALAILLIVVGAGVVVIGVVLAVCWVVVGGAAWWLLHDDSEEGGERFDRAAAVLRQQRQRHGAAIRLQAEQWQKLQVAQDLADGVARALEASERRRQRLDEIDALLRVDCAALSGPQFERHLAEVFRCHGYAVQPTGQSGDQGVDLIVTTDDGRRVAVQAKCYAGAVGNDAVQQAFAGMAFHKCQVCAVITNSTFTRAARELAERIGCAVIDGHALRTLTRTGKGI